jgi:hypothetical protein
MANSDHGIVKDKKAEDQPKDKQRAQTAHTTGPDKSVSREATRQPEPDDSRQRSGSESAR